MVRRDGAVERWEADVSEYPRNGCPECQGRVEAVLMWCDLDEEHERWACEVCDADVFRYDALIRVYADPPSFGDLDAAALLQAGHVLPSLAPWVKSKVKR